MKTVNSQDEIKKIVMVPCLLCERQMRQPFLNIRNSYPIEILVNSPTMYGALKPTALPGYLCETHYKEQEADKIQEENHEN